jgi:hypothetical protein
MPRKSRRRSSKSQSRSSQVSKPTNKPFEFNPDYSYVVKDLRTIGVMAGSFVIILVVLSFLLN